MRKTNSQLLLAFGSLFYGEVSHVDVAFGLLCLKGKGDSLSLEKTVARSWFNLSKCWFSGIKQN